MHSTYNTPFGVNASGLPHEPLPLFVWAASRPADSLTLKNLPRAAHVIARRFGLPPSHARVVAEHAGYPVEDYNV